jgi:eukaryotic-like serine/threonine-protein kinase
LRFNKLALVVTAVVAGLLLSSCGPIATQMWPGLTSNGQVAYVAQNQQVHAVDTATGRQLWAFPPAPSNQTGLFVSEPGIGDDMIVVGSEGPAGSYSGVLYGLDPATGTRRWCLAFDRRGADREGCPLAAGGQTGGFLGISPAVDNRIVGGLTVADDVVYFGLGNGSVFAVDVANGSVLWRFNEANRDVWAAPLVNDGRLYVASLDHHLYAIDRADGSLVWRRDMGGALAGTPLLIGDGLYVGTFASRMHAVDPATGQDIWPPFESDGWVWSGPTERDGILYFTDVTGTVYAVRADSGAEVWRVRPGGQMRARPVVTDGTVIVGDREGNLFALNRADGSPRWRENMRGQLLASPVLANDNVIVAVFNGDNLLVAYSADTGQFVWPFTPSR